MKTCFLLLVVLATVNVNAQLMTHKQAAYLEEHAVGMSGDAIKKMVGRPIFNEKGLGASAYSNGQIIVYDEPGFRTWIYRTEKVDDIGAFTVIYLIMAMPSETAIKVVSTRCFLSDSVQISVQVRNSIWISYSEFLQLTDGMLYDEAVKIVGSPGELLSENNVGGVRTFMVSWTGSGNEGSANAMFQQNRLVSKSQLGLK